MQQTAHPFDILNNQAFMSLTTYRRDGTPVATPVWFAREGDTIYVMTQRTAGKIKRANNNPRVRLAPCDVRGNLLNEDWCEANARVLEKSDEAEAALDRKYGEEKRANDERLRQAGRMDRVYLEIRPVE
jgi:PPOX class probable F420-dependent enzyme